MVSAWGGFLLKRFTRKISQTCKDTLILKKTKKKASVSERLLFQRGTCYVYFRFARRIFQMCIDNSIIDKNQQKQIKQKPAYLEASSSNVAPAVLLFALSFLWSCMSDIKTH